MKAISEFLPRIQPFLMGCPEPTVTMALVDAAIAFCEDTLAIREQCDAFQTAPGVRQYELSVPSQQQVARVITAWCDTSTRLKIIPADQVGNPDNLRNAPRYAYTSRASSEFLLNLYPVPDGAYSVNVEVALRPKRGATELADDLYDLYMDAMAAGAVARAAAIPNQPFSDPVAAQAASSMFMRLASRAKTEARAGRSVASQRVQPRPFA